MYATTGGFVGAFEIRETVELTNMENPAATAINFNRLNQAIGDASAEIDSYLWRYSLPLLIEVDWLRPCALDIARYRLYQNSVSEDIRNKYLDWLRKLEMVAKGQIKLAGAALVTDATIAVSHGVQTVRGDRTYTNETLRGY